MYSVQARYSIVLMKGETGHSSSYILTRGRFLVQMSVVMSRPDEPNEYLLAASESGILETVGEVATTNTIDDALIYSLSNMERAYPSRH